MRRLAHFGFGQGPRALLLLHGFLGSARNLTTFARRLADGDAALTVIGLDLTGHGGSPALPAGANLGTLAGDVLDTARDLGIATPLRLVGHSLGGRVALRAALLQAGAVAQIVLLDITPSPIRAEHTETTRVLELLLSAPAQASDRSTFRAHFQSAGLPLALTEWLLLNVTAEGGSYRWRIDRAALAALHERGNAEDLWQAVEGPRGSRIHCIRGALSGYVSDADTARLAAAGCGVDTLDGAGHFLHVDRPVELANLLHAQVSSAHAPDHA